MPFEYKEIPAKYDSGQSGGSLAFDDTFYPPRGRGFSDCFHGDGYLGDRVALSKVATTGLMQHYVLCESGILVGRGLPAISARNEFSKREGGTHH